MKALRLQTGIWNLFPAVLAYTIVRTSMAGLWGCVTNRPLIKVEQPAESVEFIMQLAEKLDGNSSKEVIGEVSGLICNALIAYRHNPFKMWQVAELKKMRVKISGLIKNKGLLELGLTANDLKKVSRALNLGVDYSLIELKLAQAGIYTHSDLELRGIVPGTKEFMIQRMIYELSTPEQKSAMIRPEPQSFQETFWTKAHRTLEKVDELAARTFAIAFNILSLCTAVMTFNYFALAYFVFCGAAGAVFPSWVVEEIVILNPSSFYDSDIVGRITWIFVNADPWRVIGASIGRGIADRNLQARLRSCLVG